MTTQEKRFFDTLTKDRSESADTLEKPSMKGVKKSVVDKYSDQAHFIYELLQNADDVHATSVHFKLESERLIFSHNGKNHFTISDPEKEEIDTELGKLGHVNAICSIANSNKNGVTEATIGKFGVGFKAVFQYTKTPYIYDPNFSFKIERFIVPVLLQTDYENRKKDETVFVFPFDDEVKLKQLAFEDIEIKLSSLIYPVLFLNDVKTVTYETTFSKGAYTKKVISSGTANNITYDFIEFSKEINDKIEKKFLWLFSQFIGDNKISVGFFVDSEGKLIEEKQTVFCFFPTKVNTNLKFIIHAPFLLTDSREGIRAGIDHNELMIQSLAELSANSLEILKDISLQKKVEIFTDDNFIKIIPYDSELFECEDERAQISFMPFYNKIKEKLENSELIPSGKFSFTNTSNAYWASYSNITDIFSNKQLRQLIGDKSAKWVFPSISRNETLRTNSTLCDYIDSLINEAYTDEKLIKLIDKDFIEKQTLNWLFKFYHFLDTDTRKRIARNKPIFLNSEKKACSAFDYNDHLVLFIIDDESKDYNAILPELLKDKRAKELIKYYGIKKPELADEVYNKILPKYNELSDDTKAFKKIFAYYKKCPQNELYDFENALKSNIFYGTIEKATPDNLYFKTRILSEYFITQQNYLDFEHYSSLVGKNDNDLLETFFKNIGVNELPKKQVINLGTFDWRDIPGKGLFNPTEGYFKNKTYIEYSFEGLEELVTYIIKRKSKKKSVVLWTILNELCKSFYDRQYHLSQGHEFIIGKCKYFYRYQRCDAYDTKLNKVILEGKWIYNNNGEFLEPSSIYIEEIPNEYILKKEDYSLLFEFLEMSHEPVKEVEEDIDYLTDEQKRKIELAERIEALGITENEIEEIISKRNQNTEEELIESNQEESISSYTIDDVYNWWLNEKKAGNWEYDIEQYYNWKHFPSIKSFSIEPEVLFNIKEGTIPKDWCLLLWVAAAQSMPYNWGNRDASNFNGINYLKQIGIFDEFCEGEDLEQLYNHYLDRANGETRIRLFEMLIRIHKYRRDDNFSKLYDLLKNLPEGIMRDSVNVKDLMVDTHNEELTGCGINLPSAERTFGLGYRLIIQNLSLCNFWKDSTTEEMKALFKSFRGYKDEEIQLSGKEYEKEFYSCLDLPFQLYEARGKY